MSLPSFLQTGPHSDAAFPPRGPFGSVPPLHRYRAALRLPNDLWLRSVAFAWPYRSVSASLGPPRFLRLPRARAMLFDPGGAGSALCRPGVAFRLSDTLGLLPLRLRGSITRLARSLSTLRSHGCPQPRKTRFRMCLAALAGRGFTRGESM